MPHCLLLIVLLFAPPLVSGDAQGTAADSAGDTSEPGVSPGDKSAPKAPADELPVRVIEATDIQGEVPFPRVLFVTAPDQRRYEDGLHRLMLKTPQQRAAEAPFPFLIPRFAAVSGIADELLLKDHNLKERSSWNSHQQ